MEQSSFYSNKKFYDDINFPYGFSRSGNFSIEEANLLTHCGFIIQRLINKECLPENEEQEHFISVISGKTKPLYQLEKLYLKYLKLTNFHIGTSKHLTGATPEELSGEEKYSN